MLLELRPIFSLGVMWVEMHLHFRTGRERIEVLSNVRQGHLPTIFESMFPAAARIAKRMLCLRPMDRANAEQLLLDPIFRQNDEGENLARSESAVEEIARLQRRVHELTFQNLALRRMLREV